MRQVIFGLARECLTIIHRCRRLEKHSADTWQASGFLDIPPLQVVVIDKHRVRTVVWFPGSEEGERDVKQNLQKDSRVRGAM